MLKIDNKVVSPFGFDYDVVNICLNGPPDEVPKASEHTTLVCSSRVFQAERHRDKAERPKKGDERSHELVGLFHGDLMVPGVRIKEAEGFAPRGRVNYLIYAWQRKQILRACLIEAGVVNTHSTFPTFLFYKNGIGQPL